MPGSLSADFTARIGATSQFYPSTIEWVSYRSGITNFEFLILERALSSLSQAQLRVRERLPEHPKSCVAAALHQ